MEDATMMAARIRRFGPPEVIVFDEIPKPVPGAGELLVRIEAAGVGPWDGWIRTGKSAVAQPLPLTLGSDIAGIVEAVGAGVSGLAVGDEVFGVSNKRFTGGYAQYSVAAASMMARKPRALDFLAAASMPVVAVTAWQMLFDQANLADGQRVLVHGAGGSVGRYAVQFARSRRLVVIATETAVDAGELRALGANEVVDARSGPFEEAVAPVDAVIDLVGGDVQDRSFSVLKPGGVLVSAVSQPDQGKASSMEYMPRSSSWM